MLKLRQMIKIGCVLLTFLMSNWIVVAQQVSGPFNYWPSETSFNLRWVEGSYNWIANKVITMNNLQSLNSTDDGLMIKFHFDRFQVPDAQRIIRFEYLNNTILSFSYSNLSFIVERRYEDKVYQYPLYDQLFSSDPEAYQFQINIYFTARFIFIAVRRNESGTDRYLSPLFFGLNTVTSIMPAFLGRNPKAIIELGDSQSSMNCIYDNVQIYSFKYSDLKNDIKNNF